VVAAVVIPIQGVGTLESSWQAWSGLAALDTFPLHPLPARAVVVAPIPMMKYSAWVASWRCSAPLECR
jgi:hypothetical protein